MSPPGDGDEDWGEIEQFVAEISQLSQSGVSLSEFATESLNRTIDISNAVGGAVWIAAEKNELRALCHADRPGDGVVGPTPDLISPSGASHTRFLQSVVHSGQPKTSIDGEGVYLWIAAPFRIQQEVIGLIEVVHPSTTSSASLRGNERLLAMVGDLTGDFLRRQQISDLRATADRWMQYESLVMRVHASLDLRDTAYQLVNDGRLFIGCDRASLVVPARGRLKAIAISGVDTFDQRSSLIQSMELLAKAVATSGQWLRYRGETQQLPPQLEQPLCAFADESHSQTIDVVPLLATSRTSTEDESELVGVLLLERFDASEDTGIEERVTRVSNLASSALRNAIEYDTLPLLSVARWVRRTRRFGNLQRPKLVMAGLLFLSAVLGLWVIPATFRVEAQGEIQPLIRRNIYAPLDGEVVDVRSGHDEDVSKDQVLVILRSRPLEIELQRLQGEYLTTQKKLLAVASARVQSDGGEVSDRYPGQLAAQEQELKQQLASQEKQIALVRQQRETLSVRSPIDGRVMTWNPKELLADRPVQQGQLLVSVADLGGPWMLELLLPDRRVGHVISAQRSREEPLDVTFALATGRAETYRGKLQKVAGRTEVVDGEQATTRVLVSVPETAIEMLRPGATIYAKVDCGQRSLGFVWLHDIIDTVKAWLLF